MAESANVIPFPENRYNSGVQTSSSRLNRSQRMPDAVDILDALKANTLANEHLAAAIGRLSDAVTSLQQRAHDADIFVVQDAGPSSNWEDALNSSFGALKDSDVSDEDFRID